MVLSNEKKKEMLLQSFNVLINNLEGNSKKIKELISKVAKIDLKTAIEMWEFILEKGKQQVHDSGEAFNFCGGLINEMEKSIGKNAVSDIIRTNDIIRKNIYGQSGDICCITYYSAREFIERNEVELANEIINYIYKNKFKEQKFEDILEEICGGATSDDNEILTSEATELLISWMDKISDEEAKARIMVSLADSL